MSHCPCCADQMLRHIRANETYWFCRHCWQEMPIMERKERNISLSPNLGAYMGQKQTKAVLVFV